jgi:hypothetical protein
MDDDLWLGFFAEVRPGYKLGFGEGASSGFSFPVTVGFGGSINFF